MFKRFLQKAAAKASLVNMGFDLKRLTQALPRQPVDASKAIFTLLENMNLALSNGAEESDLTRTIAENAVKLGWKDGDPAYEIAVAVFALVRGQRGKNAGAVEKCDSAINRAFREATGQSLDPTQIPWPTKFALAAQAIPATPREPVTRPASDQDDIQLAEAFSRRVTERLSSGEILADFDLLRSKGDTQFRALLFDEVRRKKESLERLASYGALSNDMQRMLRLCDHIIANENV